MASSSSSSSSAPPLTSRRWYYEVFLSFRGTNTRKKFVSHLYAALYGKHIITFIDDPELRVGDSISDSIRQAIGCSRSAVVVLSKDYATSKWCLEELELLMDLHREGKLKVFPVFYEVQPDEVRHQKGDFGDGLLVNLKREETAKKVPKWKEALFQVASLSGAVSTTFKTEADLIQKVVGDIYTWLFGMDQTGNLSNIVGLEAHMERLSPLLNIESEGEADMIGIWGMGGIGKSAIAKALYRRFSDRFEFSCLIDDFDLYPEKDLIKLRKRFLASILQISSKKVGTREISATVGDKKVFVVLDGVDNVSQLETIAKTPSWFGPGSRIIVTTRDMGLLRSCRVKKVYEVKCLDNDAALEMFKQVAFHGGPFPSSAYEQLSVRASQLARGLPSAVEKYAQHFREMESESQWNTALEVYEAAPLESIMGTLRISYDALDGGDKSAFRHVACLFNRDEFRRVAGLLDHGEFRIRNLANKSLVDISTDGNISMHHLLEQLGRSIMLQESGSRPCEPRLLWDTREIYGVLKNRRDTRQIEGVALHMCTMIDNLSIKRSVFEPMENLKFLKFYKHLRDTASMSVSVSNVDPLPCTLRLLHWEECPLKTLPSTFDPQCLVEVNLRNSKLKKLWRCTIPMELRNLRRLNVTGSKHLKELPDLSKATKLEELLMNNCTKLTNIPRSICSLQSLTKLEASGCDDVKSQRILIRECDAHQEPGTSNIRKMTIQFPCATEEPVSLTDLSIEGNIEIQTHALQGEAEHLVFSSEQQLISNTFSTEAHQAPAGLRTDFGDFKLLVIKRFRHGEHGSVFGCSSFSNLPKLTELSLTNLNIRQLPDDIGNLLLLEKLDLRGNDFKNLPATMEELSRLKHLGLRDCRNLRALPRLAQLQTLTLSNCTELRSLLQLSEAEADTVSYSLFELGLENCKNIESLSNQLRRLTSLRELDLSGHDFETVPTSIKELSSLRTLHLNNCRNLVSLQELPSSLKNVHAEHCTSLKPLHLGAQTNTKSPSNGPNAEEPLRSASLLRYLRSRFSCFGNNVRRSS